MKSSNKENYRSRPEKVGEEPQNRRCFIEGRRSESNKNIKTMMVQTYKKERGKFRTKKNYGLEP